MQILVAALVVLACAAGGALAQIPPFPNLTDHFVVEVEGNILDRGYTVHATEYFDPFSQAARLEVIKNGSRTVTVSDYRNQLQYTVNSATRSCVASAIMPGRMSTIGTDGRAHLTSVSDFFRFGKKYHDRYVGTAVVRGIPCAQYTSSFSNTTNGIYTSYVMQWYFALQSNWTMPSGQIASAIPVRLVLTGMSNSTGRPGATPPMSGAPLHNFHHVYEFTKFLANEVAFPAIFSNPDLFNPEFGIFCSGMPIARNLPQLPNQFSFSVLSDGGIPSENHARVSFYAYDGVRNETSVGYNADGLANYTQPGFHRIVHNFREGTAYNITHGGCTLRTLLSVVGSRAAFDIATVSSHHAALANQNAVFGVSQDLNFTYQGARVLFGVASQLWSVVRTDRQFPGGGPNQTTYWEYLFSNPTWTLNTLTGRLENMQVPLETRGFSMDPFDPFPLKQLTIINDYQVGEPPARYFDDSSCFSNAQQSTVTFALNVPFVDNYVVRQSIAQVLMSTMGVTSDRFHFSTYPGASNRLTVVVRVHDVPTIGDASLLALLPSRSDALSRLSASVKASTFRVDMGSGTSSTARPKSYQSSGDDDDDDDDDKFSSGQVAGLAVGILVLGLLIGGALTYVVLRRKNADAAYQKS